jgi:TolB protein
MLVIVWVASAGCAPRHNPYAPASEPEILTDVIRLTSGFERAGEAYFSPDMRWIVFQAAPMGEEHYQMYIARLRHEEGRIVGAHVPVRISPEGSRNTCGHFSPDGNSIIFASTAGKEDPDVPSPGYQREGGQYRWAFPAGMDIFRADGWQGAISAIEPGGMTDLARHRLTDTAAYDAEATFSPDGKWIVFTSNRDDDLELYAMRADGANPVRLTHAPGYDGGAFFSPDGRRLVYRSDRRGNNLLQIFVAEVVFDGDGSITGLRNERQLTADASVNWGPYWHPDGRHIIYSSSRHGHHRYELYLMRADGRRQTRITFHSGPDVLPVFSPDGQYLMWTSRGRDTGGGGETPTQIYLARFTLPRGS